MRKMGGGAAGGFVTRALESILKECSNKKYSALQTAMQYYIGLSKRTTSEGLRETFAEYSEVVHARVVTDRVSGYSKGFGFARYATLEGAEAGIKGMDG